MCKLDSQQNSLRHRTWPCSKNMVKCSDGLQCVHVGHICNGRPDCDDGSDETALPISPGRVNDCSLPLSPCVAISPQHWKDTGREGARCSNDTCLEVTKFCDGACDCHAAGCLDEDEGVCKDWECAKGFFKCQTTGYCVSLDKVGERLKRACFLC